MKIGRTGEGPKNGSVTIGKKKRQIPEDQKEGLKGGRDRVVEPSTGKR